MQTCWHIFRNWCYFNVYKCVVRAWNIELTVVWFLSFDNKYRWQKFMSFLSKSYWNHCIHTDMPIGRHIHGCFVLGECRAPFMLKKHCISSCCDTTFHNKVPLLSFCSSAFHQILHWTFRPSSKFLALSE
jgi:hypothetical protein